MFYYTLAAIEAAIRTENPQLDELTVASQAKSIQRSLRQQEKIEYNSNKRYRKTVSYGLDPIRFEQGA